MIDDDDDWDRHLNAAVFSINTSIHASTKVTPFLLMFGREARFPIQAEAESTNPSSIEILASEENVSQHLETSASQKIELFSKVSKNISAAQEKQKRDYNRRKCVINHHFKTGDQVLWRNMLQVTKKGHKMEDKWHGPYVVAGESKKGVCVLKNMVGVVLKKRVNVNQLKPYICPTRGVYSYNDYFN